jgi:hypothetical protein
MAQSLPIVSRYIDFYILKEEAMSIASDLTSRQLSAVIFVRDYIQLDFDGLKVTLILDPKLVSNGNVILRSSPEFCNLITKEIGNSVTHVTIADEFMIHFENDFVIAVSLRGSDRLFGPEAVLFCGTDGSLGSI